MSQIVLSEIDCLTYLQRLGVYPDEFYTDFETFKANMTFFRDATIIVIFAGNCRLNKKLTLEVVKGLMKRAESKNDNSIKHVYVVSDMTIAGLRSYYKYEGTLDTVSIMHGWKSVKDDVFIWNKLSSPKKDVKKFLSAYDSGDISAAMKRYEERKKTEDEYVSLIQVPDLRKLLNET